MRNLKYRLFVIAIIVFFYNGVGQQNYRWINRQYNPLNVSEYLMEEYYYLHGEVKLIYETVAIKNEDKTVTKTTRELEFNNKNEPTKLREELQDGSVILQDFLYSEKYEFQYQINRFLINKGAFYDTVSRDTVVLPIKETLERTKKTVNGKVLSIFGRGDSLYSFFDGYGRKTKDSIGTSITTSAHQISYIYKRNRVIKKLTYPLQYISQKLVYKIDEKGNWVFCKIKHNDKRKSVVIKRTITYY